MDLVSSLGNTLVLLIQLFMVLRVVSGLGLNKECRTELENLIGGMLEKATLNDLLVSPDTKFALHNVGLEQNEYNLSTHSDKLAVGYGLLKLPSKATVRVPKNLRICGDCHTAFKFMSMVVEREIVIRDGKRFHHFKGGKCSCGDYW